MAKLLDYSLEVSKFEHQTHYYVHFQTNTLGKSMKPPYSLSYGLNSITVALQEWL